MTQLKGTVCITHATDDDEGDEQLPINTFPRIFLIIQYDIIMRFGCSSHSGVARMCDRVVSPAAVKL